MRVRPVEVSRARGQVLRRRHVLVKKLVLMIGRPSRSDRPPVRIFMDGAFDLMHFGHMNAFRQARALGDQLVVGVNSSATVAVCKGSPTVLTDEERQGAVSACRFVDEIVPASPYVMTAEYIQEMIVAKNIDFFVHGDDPCIVDGKDVYEAAKKAGRYRSFPRTEGISTTDILGRVLALSKEHHEPATIFKQTDAAQEHDTKNNAATYACSKSQFLVTSHLMEAFRGPRSKPSDGQRIIYVDGSWDMFHAGHTSFLRKAKELGDFLLVGVHSDAVVNRTMGSNYPIMSMQERLLSVLGCRYVDDVLFDAPWAITGEMIKSLGIYRVAKGTAGDFVIDGSDDTSSQRSGGCDTDRCADAHAVPKQMGVLVETESDISLTINEIVHRLQQQRSEVVARVETKRKTELEWFNKKHGIYK